MLRCKDVTRLHSSDEIHDAPWSTRAAARIHLLLCRHCRRFVRELSVIAEAARAMLAASPDDAARDEALARRLLGEAPPTP